MRAPIEIEHLGWDKDWYRSYWRPVAVVPEDDRPAADVLWEWATSDRKRTADAVAGHRGDYHHLRAVRRVPRVGAMSIVEEEASLAVWVDYRHSGDPDDLDLHPWVRVDTKAVKTTVRPTRPVYCHALHWPVEADDRPPLFYGEWPARGYGQWGEPVPASTVAGVAVMPLGLADLQRRYGVERDTVDKWRTRGVLPPADGEVGGRPAWWPETIEEWEQRTGRSPS